VGKPYKWTISDITAGRLVCKAPGESGAADGWFAKWSYKIGWIAGGVSDMYVLINMNDGMVHSEKTRQDVLRWLRSEKMVPMREDWWQEVCGWMKTTLGLVKPASPKSFEPERDVSDDHIFPREDWIYQVKNGDTSLGYRDWLTHEREAQFYGLKIGDIVEVVRLPHDPFPADFKGKITRIHDEGELFITVSYSNQEEGDISWDVYSWQVRQVDE
jgi:hypothetical protein